MQKDIEDLIEDVVNSRSCDRSYWASRLRELIAIYPEGEERRAMAKALGELEARPLDLGAISFPGGTAKPFI